MIRIEYPDEKPAMRSTKGAKQVFCIIRKRWILLTPEEWVRQNFLLFLTGILKFPSSLIAVEKQISLGELKKRFDIIVYRDSVPWFLVECKEMTIELSADVLDQALRYNSKLQAGIIVITNGSHCYAFEKQGGAFMELNNLPLWA